MRNHRQNAHIRSIENKRLFRAPVSATFHGRDIFGPVAAHLSRGLSFEKLGPALESMAQCTLPRVRRASDAVWGSIAVIDRFGNAISTISSLHFSRGKQPRFVSVKKKMIPVVSHFCAVAEGEPLGVIGSAGFIEIAINGGNAARTLKLKRGDAVKVIGGKDWPPARPDNPSKKS